MKKEKNELEQNSAKKKLTAEEYKRLVENTKVRCTELRLLDDDFDIEKCTIEAYEKELESLAKEMIKSRIVTMPKIYVVSSVPLNKESLLQGFIKMNPILPNQSSYCVVAYFEPHYKVLKRRIGYDKQRRYRKIKKRY